MDLRQIRAKFAEQNIVRPELGGRTFSTSGPIRRGNQTTGPRLHLLQTDISEIRSGCVNLFTNQSDSILQTFHRPKPVCSIHPGRESVFPRPVHPATSASRVRMSCSIVLISAFISSSGRGGG